MTGFQEFNQANIQDCTNMDMHTGKSVVLFDFDGVVSDTESIYTAFWNSLGKEDFNIGIKDFGQKIKGQTLVQIFEKHFPDEKDRKFIEQKINELECSMPYDYIKGADTFLRALKEAGIPTAIVTSSNARKMEQVHKARPELWSIVDRVLTSEDFTKSKPDPECFLKGMSVLGGTPRTTVVFEDSFHGISAGKASGAFVIGLATTNPRESIEHLCDMVIDDFTEMTPEKLMEILISRK